MGEYWSYIFKTLLIKEKFTKFPLPNSLLPRRRVGDEAIFLLDLIQLVGIAFSR